MLLLSIAKKPFWHRHDAFWERYFHSAPPYIYIQYHSTAARWSKKTPVDQRYFSIRKPVKSPFLEKAKFRYTITTKRSSEKNKAVVTYTLRPFLMTQSIEGRTNPCFNRKSLSHKKKSDYRGQYV